MTDFTIFIIAFSISIYLFLGVGYHALTCAIRFSSLTPFGIWFIKIIPMLIFLPITIFLYMIVGIYFAFDYLLSISFKEELK